jgi:uncharacterized protein YcbX
MVVDPSGRFVTQREVPALARLAADVDGDAIVVRAPDGVEVRVARDVPGPRREVRVWSDTVDAVDVGDAAAGLLSDHADRELRLVRIADDAVRPVDPDFARAGDQTAFADGFPFLLVHAASIEALDARLAGPAIDARRFRPNLVVSGGEPWAEDGWSTIRIGDLVLHAPKPCARCAVVDVDPDRGEPDRRVLSELGTFRRRDRGVIFGQNLVHDGVGVLREGARVEVS